MKQVIDNCLNYIKEFFKNESSGHDYFHTLRVYNLAIHIASKENANTDIVKLIKTLYYIKNSKEEIYYEYN